MSAKNPRGLCARCGLPVRLRKDGTCGRHEDVDVVNMASGLRWVVCSGTGQKPRRLLDAAPGNPS